MVKSSIEASKKTQQRRTSVCLWIVKEGYKEREERTLMNPNWNTWRWITGGNKLN